MKNIFIFIVKWGINNARPSFLIRLFTPASSVTSRILRRSNFPDSWPVLIMGDEDSEPLRVAWGGLLARTAGFGVRELSSEVSKPISEHERVLPFVFALNISLHIDLWDGPAGLLIEDGELSKTLIDLNLQLALVQSSESLYWLWADLYHHILALKPLWQIDFGGLASKSSVSLVSSRNLHLDGRLDIAEHVCVAPDEWCSGEKDFRVNCVVLNREFVDVFRFDGEPASRFIQVNLMDCRGTGFCLLSSFL